MSGEVEAKPFAGAPMLVLYLALLGVAIWLSVLAGNTEAPCAIAGTVAAWIVWALISPGFFVVEPNGSKVLVLFGTYKGTVKRNGFYWANPFLIKRGVSMRARTLNTEKLKVNDLCGNPIEIAAVVVWKVTDTYAASFEVDHYDAYVATQSETALRHLAQSYPYDDADDTLSLRRNTTEVSDNLCKELEHRFTLAGVSVVEARLSHLAYASEIAGAMLRRQQAAAIIAARQMIVEGAVGMVEMALSRLEHDQALKLDDERRAAMVTNLLVVLCGEQAAAPVLNVGKS